MGSGGTRGVTVVVVVTMIFAPVFKNNHWLYRFTGKKQTSHVVRCVAGKTPKACPKRRTVVRRVYRPLPKDAIARCKGHRPCLPVRPIASRAKTATKTTKRKPSIKTAR